MSRLSTPLILAVSLLLAGCAGAASETTAPDSVIGPPAGNQGIIAGTLEVRAVPPALTLRNTTEQVVGYLVMDADQMVVALYPPCGQRCSLLVPGATTTTTYSQIAGYTPQSTHAIVHWWTYRRTADGTLQPESAVQTTRVRL